MDDESNSFTCDSDIVAKMRRLKIQESILLQNLKCFPRVNQTHDINTNIANHEIVTEFKKISAKLNDSYISNKNLFDEIKSDTYSKKMLKSVEIDDIKKKILELDASIISLKEYLGTELASLKLAETKLTKEINENVNIIDKIKKQPKLRTISYNKIIPSPVKVIMNSPFKCSEVQQFHEFMSNSQNRYGSWNEYNHNIFVKYWQKYFQTEHATDLQQNVTNIESSEVYHLFLEELLCKLQGVEKEDIRLHIKWYLKYIYLKKQQQKAVNNWKTNKKTIIQVKEKCVNNHNQNIKNNSVDVQFSGNLKDIKKLNQRQTVCSSSFINTSLEDLLPGNGILNQSCREQKINTRSEIIFSTMKNELPSKSSTGPVQYGSRLLKPTRQWISRCESNKVYVENIYKIEQTKKRRTPGWRIGLQEFS